LFEWEPFLGIVMIDQLPRQELPAWLSQATEAPNDFLTKKFPIQKILKDSVYYPACGLDGTPVKWLAGNFHSFIYADYLVTQEQVVEDICGPLKRNGFKGYKPVLQRSLAYDEILPSGWQPSMIPCSGTSGHAIDRWKTSASPFGHWSVWQRQSGLDQHHGPPAFSLLYITGEMSLVYQALYFVNQISPAVLVLIQPGSMGGEWEVAQANGSFFHQVVRAHHGGMPGYLFHGGYGSEEAYRQACWDEYRGKAIFHTVDRQAHLFRRTC